MKKILILAGRYLPGHKDGGPLRTLVNITDALCNEYEFYIACYDRDHGDTEPYSEIQYNSWNTVGNAKVWYVPEGEFSSELIKKLSEGKDVIYLTNFYEPYGYHTLLLKRTGKITAPVFLASMGVFSEGAIKQKWLKKKLFIAGCKAIGLFNDITWSVTSELEANDVKREIGKNIKFIVAEDLPRTTVPGYIPKSEMLKVAFLSRISPKKNLIYAINVLKKIHSEIEFNIYGPDEDKEYFLKCKNELGKLPTNVKWQYFGDIPSEAVQKVLSENDVFLFPTLGENYGHVIFEALSVGCIPVLSDQTPWTEVKESGAGYIFNLSQEEKFTEAVESLAMMDRDLLAKKAETCVSLALAKVERNRQETGYRKIFG